MPFASPAPRAAPPGALLALLACRAPPPPSAAEIGAYQAALHLVEDRPDKALPACAALAHPDLRVDCTCAAAEALAATDADAAAAGCAALPAGAGRDECHFQVAERSREVARCDRAGRFADDCRLHRLSQDLLRLVPRGLGPGAFEEALAAEIPRYGLAADDPRPWSAAYRWVLGQQQPLDRATCAAAPLPFQAESCRHTGIALYQDRLNHARDTGSYPCGGGALPAALAHAPDPELAGIRAAREGADLCP